MTIPPAYNLSMPANSSGAVGLIQTVNTGIFNGWFGTLVLIALFAIFMLAFTKLTGEGKRAFLATSFIVFILSVLLKGLELIPDLALYGMLAVLALSIAFSIKG